MRMALLSNSITSKAMRSPELFEATWCTFAYTEWYLGWTRFSSNSSRPVLKPIAIIPSGRRVAQRGFLCRTSWLKSLLTWLKLRWCSYWIPSSPLKATKERSKKCGGEECSALHALPAVEDCFQNVVFNDFLGWQHSGPQNYDIWLTYQW